MKTPLCSDPSIPDSSFEFVMRIGGKTEKVILYGFSVMEAFQSKYDMSEWDNCESWDFRPDIVAPAKAKPVVASAPVRPVIQAKTSFSATNVEEEETFEIVA